MFGLFGPVIGIPLHISYYGFNPPVLMVIGKEYFYTNNGVVDADYLASEHIVEEVVPCGVQSDIKNNQVYSTDGTAIGINAGAGTVSCVVQSGIKNNQVFSTDGTAIGINAVAGEASYVVQNDIKNNQVFSTNGTAIGINAVAGTVSYVVQSDIKNNQVYSTDGTAIRDQC